MTCRWSLCAIALVCCLMLVPSTPRVEGQDVQAPAIKGWKKGVGWGWIWGPQDEVGSLNAMTPKTKQAALQLAASGQVFDLGVTYSRNSYKWPGHSPGEIMSFRSPEGVHRQGDV